MPLPIEDVLAIQDNMARRAHASDVNPDVEKWVETWTEDAVLELPPGATLDLPGGAAEIESRVEGHDGLRKFLAHHLPNMVGLRHWINQVVIEGEGDSATAICYFNLIDTGQHARSVVTGRYVNTMKKVDGVWKLAYQVCEYDPVND